MPAMSENDLLRSRRSSRCPTWVVWPDSPLVSWLAIQTSRSGSWNGSGRSSRVSTTLNTVALAPMPRPTIRIANVVNPESLPQRSKGVAQILQDAVQRGQTSGIGHD